MTTRRETDEFGYPPDPNVATSLVGLTAGTGWFACYELEPGKGEWFFRPVPQFMTVRRENSEDGSRWLCTFGVDEFLGENERMDWGSQFRGYAHESDFVVLAQELSERAKARMEYGDGHMCGDPRRLYEGGRLVEA